MGNMITLSDRIKLYYENSSVTYLTRRTPVIIRIDGKAFHTFTQGLKKPFDKVVTKAMQETMKYLCENIQGCVLGYTQSDEISLLLIDYQSLDFDAFFGYKVQKLCSVSASMATFMFNKSIAEGLKDLLKENSNIDYSNIDEKYITTLTLKTDKGALFDSRCFNIPKDEVNNYFIWRQQDALRNSIYGVGNAYFSHSQLHGKNGLDIQEMLKEKNVYLDNFDSFCLRGSCYIKKNPTEKEDVENEEQTHKKWTLDLDIPLFKENREYVNDLVFEEENN